MKRLKKTTGFLLVLICLCGSVSAATYNCNGCVDCTAKLDSALNGDTVLLTTSITNASGECIRMNGQINVAFDCQGNTIQGSDTDYGIHVNSGSRNTIRNCVVTGFSHGIQIYGSSSNYITRNTVNGNANVGIYVLESENNTFTNNTANENGGGGGIFVAYSNNCSIINNTANANSEYGIQLYYSDYAKLTDNSVASNMYGIYLNRASENAVDRNRACSQTSSDFRLTSSYANNGDYNTCDLPSGWNDTGRTGCRYPCGTTTTTTIATSTTTTTYTTTTTIPPNGCNGCSDCTAKIKAASYGSTVTLTANIINQNGSCIFFDKKSGITFDCNDNRIEGNGTDYSSYGIFVNYSANDTVKNCNVSKFNSGIYVYHSNNTAVLSSASHDNTAYGILLYASDNGTVSWNTVSRNTASGIVLYNSKLNRVVNNTASYNSVNGIYLLLSNATTVTGNTAQNNSAAGMYLYLSHYNNLANNTIGSDSETGIRIYSSNTNLIMRNTVCSNKVKDINQTSSSGNAGYNNTCDTVFSWSDAGYAGCRYSCPATTTTTSTSTSTTGQTTSTITTTSTTGQTTTTATSTTSPTTSTTMPSLPDLSIPSIWVVGSEIRYSLWNYGPAVPASTSYLYVDTVYKASGAASAFAAGILSSVESFAYNWTCSGVSDTIRICADAPGLITERNETNNCLIDTFDCSAATTTTSTTSTTSTTYRKSPKISVSRGLPLSAARGSSLVVNVSMDVNESSAPPAAGIIEYYPSGWTVSAVSHGGLNKSSPGRIEWVFWPQGYTVKDQVINYTLQIPSDADGAYGFSGTVDIGEVNVTDVTGNNSILISECALAGDHAPCGQITIGEVVAYINLWAEGKAPLSSVVALVSAWKKKLGGY